MYITDDLSTDSYDSSVGLASKSSAGCAQSLGPRKGRFGEGEGSNYKTELCKNFEVGKPCKWGSNCCFAHGKEELRSRVLRLELKSKSCRGFNDSGVCSYGVRCQFLHSKSHRRFQQTLELVECSVLSKLDAKEFGLLARALKEVGGLVAAPRLKCFKEVARMDATL